MFPQKTINAVTASSSSTTMGRVFLFDFTERAFVLSNGRPVEATYEEAIRQWVTMVITTEQDKYGVYNGDAFGLKVIQFIGRKDLPTSAIISELRRQIEEQLTKHPEITGIANFTVTRSDSIARISFSLKSRNGLIEGVEQEVKFVG
ncbi:hypothetical protein D3C75_760140 [compost metagenome]